MHHTPIGSPSQTQRQRTELRNIPFDIEGASQLVEIIETFRLETPPPDNAARLMSSRTTTCCATGTCDNIFAQGLN